MRVCAGARGWGVLRVHRRVRLPMCSEFERKDEG